MSDVLPPVLGAAWGAMVAMPVARRAGRIAPTRRAAGLVPLGGNRSRRQFTIRLPGAVGRVFGAVAGRQRSRRIGDELGHELPVVIDLLAVAVAAGCTPYLSVVLAARWAPPRSAKHLIAVRRACDLGAGFADALDALARDESMFAGLVDALLASERFGAPVGSALSRLATEQRAELRRHAEARARTVPVRLLFPLVFLVLPAFGLLTVAPAVLIGFGQV